MPILLFLLIFAFWWMIVSITWWFPFALIGLCVLEYFIENLDWWRNKRKKE